MFFLSFGLWVFWPFGIVGLLAFGLVAFGLLAFGLFDHWSFGLWSFGLWSFRLRSFVNLAFWFFGLCFFGLWSFGLLVVWSFGRFGLLAFDMLVFWLFGLMAFALYVGLRGCGLCLFFVLVCIFVGMNFFENVFKNLCSNGAEILKNNIKNQS